ncbi:transglycosylase domain-containing protein [Nocardioides perillae]|uniref:Membrane peptidoglycan carboxypeptidase n=1 Tax=Nocardioides perillae TaxID=1119534 RepID=A0A7Y9RU21_9ACTN|nr:membrane peptidoglycan carboxypeptidase [Nocardioides perillae]
MSGKRRADGPASTKRPQPGPKRTRKQRLQRAAAFGGIGFLVLTLLGAATFVVLYQAIEIPDPNEDFQTQTTFVYYADGERELGQFAEQNRDSIPLSEMPQNIQDAVVAAENQTFWTDQGIDPKGIVRAAFNNAQGGAVQGASTITQQYVKILYLTQERALKRKIKEAFLSLKVQRQQSKREILEGYLNTIYFGRGAYGIQAASEAFFDVEAKDLNLRQAAVLASVLNNPSALDPANGEDARERLRGRYEYVLTQMAETEAIDEQRAERAMQRLPKFPEIEADNQYGGQRGHVLTMVKDELLRLGFQEEEIEGGGLRVTTTFTRQAMDAAREGVEAQRPEGFGPQQLHVGVASVEPGTGAVRGIYGGQDYLQSQINWAVAGGQAGSTFKPFAVAAALEQGFSLRDTFEGNSPLVLPDGTDVENQGDSDYGRVDMLTATENSINTAFIDMTLGMEEGPESIIETAVKMGIPPAEPRFAKAPGFPNRTPGLEPVLGVSLGSQTVSPVNMAAGYATIAAGGRAAAPYVIEKVVDESGETRYQHRDESERAISEDIAADVSYAMEQVVQSGSGTAALGLGRPAAGKTGTATKTGGAVSSSWFAGFTPQLATAVMYVRGDGTGQLDGWLPEFFGGSYPARTWTDVMTRALEGEEVLELAEPAFVDGDAPSDGYEPVPTEAPEPEPAPQPTRTREPQPEPSEEPTPTQEPTPTPTPEPEPTDCSLIGGCETEEPQEPTPTPTPEPQPTSSSPSPTAGSRPSTRPSPTGRP